MYESSMEAKISLECAIATAPLNKALVEQRAFAKQRTYKRGATLLLREALAIDQGDDSGEAGKRCVTDPQETVTERVGRFQFEFPAGLKVDSFSSLNFQEPFSRTIT